MNFDSPEYDINSIIQGKILIILELFVNLIILTISGDALYTSLIIQYWYLQSMTSNQPAQGVQHPPKTHKALVLHQFGKPLVYQDLPILQLQEGQLLVRVEGSTINPSDKYKIAGLYGPVNFPLPAGIEGTGRVVQAKGGPEIQSWVGKRVTFVQDRSGTWAEYSITKPSQAFEIEEDVALHSAASGFINPLTAIGMTEIYNATQGKQGLIHTAAASALGRMLNKFTQSLGIPLLNIVRKEEQAALLRSQGAQHVIVTQGNWQKQYIEVIKQHKFNVLFDALGGGPVTETLISNLNAGSYAYLYGSLENRPLNISMSLRRVLSKGVFLSGYVVYNWYWSASEDRKNWIRSNYSKWLKTDLATHPFKTLPYSQIELALELSATKATEGKVTLVPD